MSATASDLRVSITRVIPASCRRVFEAWLDPAALAAFIKPQAGMTVPKTEVDAREGGRFLIVMKAGGQEIPHHGEYRVVQRYSRLAFTWHSPFTAPESLVTLDFEEQGDEQTRLTLRHVGFPSDELRCSHEEGWTAIIETLAGEMAG